MHIDKCTEEDRNIEKLDPSCDGEIDLDETGIGCQTVDPPCETTENIENWLKAKKISMLMLGYKVDFRVGYFFK